MNALVVAWLSRQLSFAPKRLLLGPPIVAPEGAAKNEPGVIDSPVIAGAGAEPVGDETELIDGSATSAGVGVSLPFVAAGQLAA
ncbi:MAG TPA: hypothetical protein VH081_03500 [Solirubrobacteraceae bacterium]|nr:hypothetical protein [Solirubrobacteraceae bacterium]